MFGTFITLCAICTSFISVLQLITNHVYISVLLALISFVIDCLDGYVARLNHTDSDIGRQLDSMADAVIYIIWPALFYFLYFNLRGVPSILILCIFVCTGLYRLARFNHMGMIQTKLGVAYPGIPVVFSHMIILIFILLRSISLDILIPLQAAICIHSMAMVSKIPFRKPNTYLILILVSSCIVLWILYGKYITQ